MDIQIRHAEERDIDVIAENVVAMAYESCGENLDQQVVLQGVLGLFKKPELGFYIVAEYEGTVIGSLVIVYEWSDWRNGKHWWIHSVYVSSEYRGWGVYARMYDYVKELMKASEDSRDLKLSVEGGNTRAQKAYEKLGMRAADLVTYYSE